MSMYKTVKIKYAYHYITFLRYFLFNKFNFNPFTEAVS